MAFYANWIQCAVGESDLSVSAVQSAVQPPTAYVDQANNRVIPFVALSRRDLPLSNLERGQGVRSHPPTASTMQIHVDTLIKNNESHNDQTTRWTYAFKGSNLIEISSAETLDHLPI
jgi:hypothetical protein